MNILKLALLAGAIASGEEVPTSQPSESVVEEEPSTSVVAPSSSEEQSSSSEEQILKMFDAQIKHCAQFMGVVK